MSAVGRAGGRAQSAPQLVRVRGQVDAGARIPVLALFVVIGLLEFGLGPAAYAGAAGISAGVLLALVSPWIPLGLGPWGAIVILALGQFTRPVALSWHFFVLLAGLHLLHVLGSLAAQLPWRGWLEPRVVARPLARFSAVQAPVQIAAALALGLLAPDAHGHRPVSWAGFALIGLLALAVLTLVLIRPLRRESQRRET